MNSILLFSSKFLILFLAIYGFTMQNEALSNIYKFNFTSIEGQTINLEDFKGKPLLIVNSASLCGFTNQYNDLEEIYNKYRKKGLIVISVPSNDFGSQELSSNKKVNDFLKLLLLRCLHSTLHDKRPIADFHVFKAKIRSNSLDMLEGMSSLDKYLVNSRNKFSIYNKSS